MSRAAVGSPGAPPPAEVLAWMRGHSESMAALLAELVALESPSGDRAGQQAMASTVGEHLTAAGMGVRRVRGAMVGDHLLARPRRHRGGPRQLVVGHLDTVWPIGTAARRGPRRVGDRLYGPGCFDMKGGLVQMLWALRYLHEVGARPPAEVVVLCNTDEEIGSPDSRRWIDVLARLAVRAFVLEGAAGAGGALKLGRKGVGRYAVRVRGRSGHAAGAPARRRASAVLEISHQIQALFALDDPERGVSVNVGKVDGGLRPNVVAADAVAHVDVRVPRPGDAERFDRAIRSLRPTRDGVTVEVEGGFHRPPMERTGANHRLWRQAEAVAGSLGWSLSAATVGGASDANLTSRHVATLDGLGAVGGGGHALDEHVRITSLPERAALLALLLLQPVDAPPVAPPVAPAHADRVARA